MSIKRVDNFYAGPSPLPLEILKKAQEEFLSFGDSGMSLMEMSHRSPVYDEVHQGAKSSFRKAFNIPI